MNDDYATVLSPTEVRFQRLLPGPIETVWTHLTASKKRGEWFASGPMEPRVGGKVTLRFKHSDLSPHNVDTSQARQPRRDGRRERRLAHPSRGVGRQGLWSRAAGFLGSLAQYRRAIRQTHRPLKQSPYCCWATFTALWSSPRIRSWLRASISRPMQAR